MNNSKTLLNNRKPSDLFLLISNLFYTVFIAVLYVLVFFCSAVSVMYLYKNGYNPLARFMANLTIGWIKLAVITIAVYLIAMFFKKLEPIIESRQRARREAFKKEIIKEIKNGRTKAR